jgi:hypothetical protein
MATGDVINLATAVLALAVVILLFRLFRGDIGDNKGGLAAAAVVLGGLAYYIRTESGRQMVDHLLALLR